MVMVRLRGATPMNTSGPQLLLLALGFVFFVVAPLVLDTPWVVIAGWLFLAMSWGTSAEIEDGVLRLRYLFGRMSREIHLDEIDEVKVIRRLRATSLAGEFPLFFLLVFSTACFSILVVLTHPSRDYTGYTVLFLVSFVYLLLLLLPFENESIGMALLVLPMILGFLLWLAVPAAVDFAMVVAVEIALVFTYLNHYVKHYVVLGTSRGKCLIAFDDQTTMEVFLKALGGSSSGV
ncbi:hypothetical protein E3E38_05065 [Thermococcus sp. 18S1]|uniref:hypothetical protein n=1 Tax=Thermococcus sp. 18S1 TaxID=1638210 RepID=UPI00143BEC70|nr:hypothetical protein [Thermococcus sp. 18S1]NJE30421.1 hypothetical protein [Thermococcus sp. 18S1]